MSCCAAKENFSWLLWSRSRWSTFGPPLPPHNQNRIIQTGTFVTKMLTVLWFLLL